MNTTTTHTHPQGSSLQLVGASVARAAAMVGAIERLALLLEDRCDPEGFALVTAVQACTAEARAELEKADNGVAAIVPELSAEAA